MGKQPFKVNVMSVEPDKTLKAKEGWINMILRWVIDENTMGSKLGVLGYTIFPPGAQHAPHIHENAEEFVIVMKGRGIQSSGEYEYEIGPGDVVFIPKGAVHFTKNTSDGENLEIFFVYAGAPSLKKAGYKQVT
jgi:quercetin dioxygenase-like cupin family protein